MKRLLLVACHLAALSVLLSGCSLWGFGGWERAQWRHDAEAQCISSGRLHLSEYVTEGRPTSDGDCGADHPFRVQAVSNGMVGLSEVALLNCPMTVAMDDWVEKVVQPQAAAMIGQPVVALKLLGSYTCRRIAGAHSMSEHAYMNAIDIAGFKFADGREILVRRDWSGDDPVAGQFLRAVGDRSCEIFNTVLGPDYNADHRDHFHLDLAARLRSHRRICKGGQLHEGPMSYGLPVFTGSLQSKIDEASED
eukprot:gene27434-30326_t